MTPVATLSGLCLLATLFQAPPQPLQPPAEDPGILAVVEAFFRAQEAEDARAYFALWSARARKPLPEQLAYVFKSGDDRFSGIAIRRVVAIGDLRRVLVSVVRERTSASPGPDGQPRVTTSTREWSLTLALEGDGLKILSEGYPADDMAAAIIAARTPGDLDELLEAEPEWLNARLLSAITSRADSLAQTQRFAAARDIYGKALIVARRAERRKDEGEALQSIANTYYFERNLPRALDFYEERLTLERRQANDAGIAAALQGIATIKYSSFEYGEALPAYQAALAVYERIGDEAGMAAALLSTGNVLFLQGLSAEAIADYTRSRTLYRKAHNTEGEASALAGLGRVYMSQGDYATGLEAFAGVLEQGRARGNPIMQANALHSTGEIHLRLGNAGAARTAFASSRGHFEAAADPAAIGRSWQGTALAELLAARFEPAEAAYAESIKACTAAADRECIARAIVGLAFAQYSRDRFDHAVASYRKAIDAFLELKKPEEAGRAEVGLSQALFGRGDFEAAAGAAASAGGRTPAFDVLWRAHLAGARAYRATRTTDRAMALSLEAVRVVEAMARAAIDQPSRRMSPDSDSVYTFHALVQAEAGDAAAAFEAVERGRTHALRVALAPHEREIVRRMTAEEREAERVATARLGSLQAQIEKEEALPKPNAQRLAQLRQFRDSATAERLLQRLQLFDRWPDLRIWRGLALPASRAEIESLVSADGAPVVQFAIDQDDLLAVVAAPDENGTVRFAASATPMPRRTLAELVAAAVDPATLRDAQEWLTRGALLAAALPDAARETLIGSSRATVIPDDILWRVPFEALPLKEGYLAASTEVAYATSVTAIIRPLDAARSDLPAETPAPIVVAAAPALTPERAARIGATAPDWTVRDGDVALRESSAVVARFEESPVSPHALAGATEAVVRRGLGSARLAHIAAPFRIGSASPMFSPVLLAEPAPAPASPSTAGEPAEAPPVDPGDDGALEVREVANLEVRAEAVVLSDGSALSMRDAASALPVVRWAWRAAGAGTLVVRRWNDDHPSGDTLVADFHARMHAGADARTALHAAAGLLRGDPQQPPWFWASWIVVR